MNPKRTALGTGLLVTALLSLNSAAGAAVLTVPGEFTTIQAAVDEANMGDLVMVAPGTYQETLSLPGGITLLGTGGRPEDTVITGGYLRKVMSLVGDSRPARIENLTMRDGFSGSGGGITVDGADVTFIRVNFIGCTAADEGGALFANNARITLRFCLFYANYSLGGGGGAVHIQGSDQAGSTQVIEYCTFAANSGCCGGTSLVMAECRLSISNNIMEDVSCLPGAEPTFTCNDGDVCGTDGGGNFIDDPMYCGFEYADCRLEPESPCLAENNPACGQIGAFKACAATATATSSFSAVKQLYR